MPDPNAYAWIHEVFADAACVTVVHGGDEASVLSCFGAAAGSGLDVSQLGDDGPYGDGAKGYVLVTDVPGGVLAVEYNGFAGSLEETVARLSAPGRAASMFWNVNDDNAFSCARGGDLIATVDMYDAEYDDETGLPESLSSLFAQAANDAADLHAIGMAMVEEYTGISISEDTVASLHRAYPIAYV